METRFEKELNLLIATLQAYAADTEQTEIEKMEAIDYEIECFQALRTEPNCDSDNLCQKCIDLLAQWDAEDNAL